MLAPPAVTIDAPPVPPRRAIASPGRASSPLTPPRACSPLHRLGRLFKGPRSTPKLHHPHHSQLRHPSPPFLACSATARHHHRRPPRSTLLLYPRPELRWVWAPPRPTSASPPSWPSPPLWNTSPGPPSPPPPAAAAGPSQAASGRAAVGDRPRRTPSSFPLYPEPPSRPRAAESAAADERLPLPCIPVREKGEDRAICPKPPSFSPNSVKKPPTI